jgi:orotate phosphoribosyltransferase
MQVKTSETQNAYGAQLIRELYARGMIKTWYRDRPEGWTSVSGLWSPLYIQLRTLSSYPDLLRKIGEALSHLVKASIPQATQLIGIAMAGIPITVATALTGNFPCAMTRKLEGIRSVSDFQDKLKAYGEHSMVEGELKSGDTLVLIDDLVTKFDSKLIALKQLEYEIRRRSLENVTCRDVVVIFDREQGAKEAAFKAGINLYSLIPFKSSGLNWLADMMDKRESEVIKAYLEDSSRFQNMELQGQLQREALDNKGKSTERQ